MKSEPQAGVLTSFRSLPSTPSSLLSKPVSLRTSADFKHPLTQRYSTQSHRTGRLFIIACAVFPSVTALVQAQEQSALTNAPSPVLQPPKIAKHDISVSADFLLGQGTITVPAGFSLAEAGGFGAQPIVNDADRDSLYFGATISYSFGQAWYFDLGYASGSSSGSISYDAGGGVSLPSDFTLDDNWYQAYVRYTFPQLRGKRLSAYLRAGVSYVQADLNVESVFPGQGLYKQEDETTDLLGNLGFGVTYALYSSRRFRIGFQVEGEAFYGNRSQDSTEELPRTDLSFPTASIDNTLYGGIGRATVRLEYRLGQSFKAFLDAGGTVKYTIINYESTATFSGDSFNEILWGPYVKLGLRYAF